MPLLRLLPGFARNASGRLFLTLCLRLNSRSVLRLFRRIRGCRLFLRLRRALIIRIAAAGCGQQRGAERRQPDDAGSPPRAHRR